MDGKFSSNHGWKSKYFFAIGQWEFHPTEAVEGPRVPRETCASVVNASKEPWLIEGELLRINNILNWAQKHKSLMAIQSLSRWPRKD